MLPTPCVLTVTVMVQQLLCLMVVAVEALAASVTGMMPVTNIFLDILAKGQAPPTANGMLFASIEDETGLHNLVIPPPIYKLYRQIIENNSFLCVGGIMQKEQNAFSVMARHFYAPQTIRAKVVTLDRRHARPTGGRPKDEHTRPLPAAAGETLIRTRDYR